MRRSLFSPLWYRVAGQHPRLTPGVRAERQTFRGESFAVWRCAECKSIHAEDAVDLAHYYARYPVFDAALDWKLYVVYGGMLQRLERAGLTKSHRVLDYGCGSGILAIAAAKLGAAQVAASDNDPQAPRQLLAGFGIKHKMSGSPYRTQTKNG